MNQDLILFSIKKKSRALSPVPSTIFYADGCPFRCKGCLYWESHEKMTPKRYSVRECADVAIESNAGCIILSGGDPLLQAGAFSEMIEVIRERISTGLIIYCGETDDEIAELRSNDKDVDRLINMSDMIISGRYEADKDCGQKYIGSSNQHVIFLTERYKRFEKEYEYIGRNIEITLNKNNDKITLNYSGVPNKYQRSLFEQLIEILSGKSIPIEYDYHIASNDSAISIYSNVGLLSRISFTDNGLTIYVWDIDRMDVRPLSSAIVDQMHILK